MSLVNSRLLTNLLNLAAQQTEFQFMVDMVEILLQQRPITASLLAMDTAWSTATHVVQMLELFLIKFHSGRTLYRDRISKVIGDLGIPEDTGPLLSPYRRPRARASPSSLDTTHFASC